ncbi:hypothetical protein SAMN04488587_1522 [Methanococcoides vulcani]|uniref:Uncharacterized protein n=2 Tax=Methanococcoides vulcani TaxID=1353158 RepID=A0A1I0AA81_9EURY|nr:hypothetical protein [Methanococcoides vulcani]SES91046.1 hypothetical protein SAMN04488587_1522 [Methanococcoides vulcani]
MDEISLKNIRVDEEFDAMVKEYCQKRIHMTNKFTSFANTLNFEENGDGYTYSYSYKVSDNTNTEVIREDSNLEPDDFFQMKKDKMFKELYSINDLEQIYWFGKCIEMGYEQWLLVRLCEYLKSRGTMAVKVHNNSYEVFDNDVYNYYLYQRERYLIFHEEMEVLRNEWNQDKGGA